MNKGVLNQLVLRLKLFKVFMMKYCWFEKVGYVGDNVKRKHGSINSNGANLLDPANLPKETSGIMTFMCLC